MMTGRVQDGYALVAIPFQIAGLPGFSLDFAVDTGFVGCLTLPPDAVAALRLPFSRMLLGNLADDSVVEMAVHRAIILWNGEELDIPVLATGRRPLLGRALLDGYELRVRFAEGDTVTVEALYKESKEE